METSSKEGRRILRDLLSRWSDEDGGGSGESGRISLEAALSESRDRLREALTAAGIKEHRAVVTGRAEDGEAYRRSLELVGEAYAVQWAYEAFAVTVRVVDLQKKRDATRSDIEAMVGTITEQIADGEPAANIGSIRASLAEANHRLDGMQPFPLAALRVGAPRQAEAEPGAGTGTGAGAGAGSAKVGDSRRAKIRRKLSVASQNIRY